METNNMADYFAAEGEMGHIGYLSGKLAKEIAARFADLQIIDALADPVDDAELIINCQHDNDIIIGMIYSAQAAIEEATEMLLRRPVFAVQQL